MNTLKTLNLDLLPIELNNLDDLFKLRSNKEVVKFVEKKADKTKKETKLFIQKIIVGVKKNETFYWGIHLKNKQNLVGTICLWSFNADKSTAEIGYELHPDFQQKGYMLEASKSIIQYGFEILGLKTISAYTNKLNESSLMLLKKLQFQFTSTDNDYLIYELINTI